MIRTLLVTLFVIFSSSAAAQDNGKPSFYEGFWVTPNFSSVVELSHCEQSLCAEIVWLWSVSIAGRQLLDEKNSNSENQKQPLVGLQLFRNFEKEDELWRGRIYNPEDGRNYRATITARGKNSLSLKGCWGPFCRSQRWRRLSSISMPTEADLRQK